MKQMWNIADHGGKHEDPVSSPPTIRIHCLEQAGTTVRGEQTHTGSTDAPKNFKGGSDPGLCGR